MDCLPTKQMLFRHEAVSSLLLGRVPQRHRAWPVIWTMSTTDGIQKAVLANLCSREVVAGSERGRVLVECWLAIFIFRIVWKMWKTEKARLFWLALLLKVLRIHFEAAKKWGLCDIRQLNG